jgi:hypothetical protein
MAMKSCSLSVLFHHVPMLLDAVDFCAKVCFFDAAALVDGEELEYRATVCV